MAFVKEEKPQFKSELVNSGRDSVEPLKLTDLEEDDPSNNPSTDEVISPRELTQINFRSLIGHSDEVNTCSFSPDWSRVVTGGDDNLVKLWDTKSGKVLFTLEEHQGAIKCVCFSSDGQLFASASYDHTVRIWDTTTGKQVYCLQGHTHSVETCCFSPDCQFLCSGSWDNSAVVWSLKSGTPAFVLNGHRNVIQTCAFSFDSKNVATGSWDCTVRIWSLCETNNVDVKCLKGHKSNVHATAFSPDDVLASASWDMTIRLWDSKTGELLHILTGHTGWVQACSFNSTGELLASASDDQTVRIWDTKMGKCVKELECNTDEVHTCSFTPNGSLFASGPAEIISEVVDKNRIQYCFGNPCSITVPKRDQFSFATLPAT